MTKNKNKIEIKLCQGPLYAELLHQMQADCFATSGERLLSLQSCQELLAQPVTRFYVAFYESSINQKSNPVAYLLIHCSPFDADILSIGTISLYQRQGFAKALLIHAITNLQREGLENIFLEVRADNLPAIKAYESLGFQQFRIRKNYYRMLDGTHKDALLFINKL